MWLFLSARLRTWLLLGIGLPLLRRLIARLAASAQRTHPDGRAARYLHTLDTALGRFAARLQRKGRRGPRRRQ